MWLQRKNWKKYNIYVYICTIFKNGKEELTLGYVVQKSFHHLTLCPNGTRSLNRWASRAPGCFNIVLCSDGGDSVKLNQVLSFPLAFLLISKMSCPLQQYSLFPCSKAVFFFWAMPPFICRIKENKICKLLTLEVYMRETQSLTPEPWNGCQSPASAAKKGPANAVRFAPSATALSDSYGPVHIHWKLASGNDIQFDNIRCLGFLAQVRCSELIALWAEFQLWSVPWDIGCVWLRKKGKEWKLISRKVSDEQHLSLKGKMGIISLSV